MNLKEKKILITGAGTGMGQGCAIAFANQGCQVTVAGRRLEKLQETAELCRPATVLPHTVDVADRDNVNELVAWATEKMGRIDILIHSAGVNIKQRSMLKMEPEEWDRVLAINATGPYNCMRAVLPQMRERADGLIVNISSVAGKRASDLGGIAYCASKFAATGLGTAAGLEEAARGIRITNVYPGEVDTPLLEQRPNPVSDEHRQRMLKQEDIAQVVLAIAQLPSRAHIPEVVVKPTVQNYS
ncbi:MAG: SDR family NAD(P)-dependent oxidoreductase [Pirellulaceae bacterium]|nr:SDR family NAD(P)-dependent oxidoreductase [Pirellulaceae bacterium]